MSLIRNRNKIIYKKAVTLIELLLTTALVSVVSLTIYFTISNGVKIWQRIKMNTDLEDIYVFFDKFRTDLKNTFYFTGIYFTGESERVEFPALVYSPAFKRKVIGKVIYVYDKKHNSLIRKQLDISEIYNERRSSSYQILNNIISANFKYYFYDANKQDYYWEEEWKEKEFPLAVKIELELADVRDNKKFVKTVEIPVAE